MMPFFTISNPRMGHPLPMPVEQIEAGCRQRTLDELLKLKERMQAFYQRESKNRKEAIARLEQLPGEITELQARIEQTKKDIADAEARNKSIFSSLPGNGAERYLALQSLSRIPSHPFDLEQQVKSLEDAQKKLKRDVAWINYEFDRGNEEYPAVLKVIAEKTPEMTPDSAPPISRRM